MNRHPQQTTHPAGQPLATFRLHPNLVETPLGLVAVQRRWREAPWYRRQQSEILPDSR